MLHLAVRLPRSYEHAWAEQGFADGTRARRANAGQAPPKFDPEELEEQQAAMMASQGRPARSGATAGGRRPPSQGGRSGGAEVSSHGRRGPLPRLEDLAEGLNQLDPDQQARDSC